MVLPEAFCNCQRVFSSTTPEISFWRLPTQLWKHSLLSGAWRVETEVEKLLTLTPVCLSVCLPVQFQIRRTAFLQVLYCIILLNFVDTFQFWLTLTTITEASHAFCGYLVHKFLQKRYNGYNGTRYIANKSCSQKWDILFTINSSRNSCLITILFGENFK